MKTLVKICGICDPGSARVAADAGADLLGFHFCDSSRRVEPEAVSRMLDGLGRRPQIVGVFINQPLEEIRQIADYLDLDWLQLHGSEEPGPAWPRPVMKVLKVREGSLPDPGPWPDPIMLDSWSADHRGGTGQTWDWERARELISRRQVFFAGGLNPANVAEVVRSYAPHGVDVSSGVESAPRVKNPDLVRAFLAAVRAEDGREG